MDKYYVYRPMLDLLGKSEGTDKGRGYNETLAYGAFTEGNVNLISMTLSEIDKLQTKMLAHPKNNWNSSALGRYQIVRTTLRSIKKKLELSAASLFDEDMQDRMGCYLLGVRGIDKYLSGRLAEDTLINNLAQEWASLPTTEGKGHYDGQNSSVSVAEVRKVLAEVKRRHKEGQPTKIETVTVEVPVPVEIEKPVVPKSVENEVRQKTNWGAWASTIFGALSALGTWALNADKELVFVILGFGVFGIVVFLVGGELIIRRIRSIKKAIEE